MHAAPPKTSGRAMASTKEHSPVAPAPGEWMVNQVRANSRHRVVIKAPARVEKDESRGSKDSRSRGSGNRRGVGTCQRGSQGAGVSGI